MICKVCGTQNPWQHGEQSGLQKPKDWTPERSGSSSDFEQGFSQIVPRIITNLTIQNHKWSWIFINNHKQQQASINNIFMNASLWKWLFHWGSRIFYQSEEQTWKRLRNNIFFSFSFILPPSWYSLLNCLQQGRPEYYLPLYIPAWIVCNKAGHNPCTYTILQKLIFFCESLQICANFVLYYQRGLVFSATKKWKLAFFGGTNEQRIGNTRK